MYIEQMTMTKKMDKYTKGDAKGNRFFHLLEWLDIDPESHRHVFRDLRTPCIMISLFFSTAFFESESDKEFRDPLLINQIEGAQKLSNRRRDELIDACQKISGTSVIMWIRDEGTTPKVIPSSGTWSSVPSSRIVSLRYLSCAGNNIWLFEANSCFRYNSVQSGHHKQRVSSI